MLQPKKIKIYKTSLPKASVLSHSKTNYDFVDSFQGLFHDTRNTITPTVVAKAFFSSGPKWVENLLILRNKMVGVIGFKTSDAIKNKEKILENFQLEPGQQIGLFTVFTKTKNEVVLGENDKHLDFRISLFLEECNENNKK